MISVVIPLYNKEHQIRSTLNSVLSQTFQDFEVIIVNDGSTDSSVEKVQKISDSRIRLIHQKNLGVSAARNRGIKESKGEWIAFLDADDEWLPEYLQTQIELSRKYPQAAVCATGYILRDQDGKLRDPLFSHLNIEEDGVINNYFEIVSSSSPLITSISVFIKKEALIALGGFLLDVTLGEDLITWAKLACRYPIVYSSKKLAIYNFPSIQMIIPGKIPDKIDLVGEEFGRLYQEYGHIKGLKEYVALWHKMRMATFVRLKMKHEADISYRCIKSYVKPTFKVRVWYLLNHMPPLFTRGILKCIFQN
ncbi:glycosyltransferase family 2 protein [Porphyromonas macacae]|uniref:glycosyltransferase family 2 protein n=1 Tax=Porphyromonas macacae TaxID=28115 RepID=UPI0006907AF7|nr:glycosyltransferase family A protein [Porphyromonas macacae]